MAHLLFPLKEYNRDDDEATRDEVLGIVRGWGEGGKEVRKVMKNAERNGKWKEEVMEREKKTERKQ